LSRRSCGGPFPGRSRKPQASVPVRTVARALRYSTACSSSFRDRQLVPSRRRTSRCAVAFAE